MPWRILLASKFLLEINMDPATHNPAGKAAVIIKIENGEFVYHKTFVTAVNRSDQLGKG